MGHTYLSLVGLNQEVVIVIKVSKPSVTEACGKSAFERGQGPTLFGYTIYNKWFCETISSFDGVWDLFLGGSVEIDDRCRETISSDSIIKALWFQHVKPFLLIPLKDV